MINYDEVHLSFHIELLAVDGCHCCYYDYDETMEAEMATFQASMWSALNEQLYGRWVARLDLAASDKYIRLWLAQELIQVDEGNYEFFVSV